MYRAGTRPKNKKRRRRIWLIIILLLLIISWFSYGAFKKASTPKSEIKQAKATYKKIDYSKKTQIFSNEIFEIELPATWHTLNQASGSYKTYSYQSNSGSDGQIIQIFVDTIPVNFAVNKALIIKSQGDKVSVESPISDNCTAYTKNSANVGQYGAAARWQGVDFLCDMANTSRNVIGTSSVDGINTVVLKSPSTGRQSKLFFTDTANGINPDYNTFVSAVNSFRMK